MSFIEDTKYFNERAELTVKCKCGCSVPMAKRKRIVTCRWCGGTVFRNKQVEFEYKLSKELKKNN